MADIEGFFNLIRPWAKGCPEPGMQDALVTSAREFAAETLFVQRNVVVTTNGTTPTQNYPIAPPSQEEEIIEVVSGQGVDSNGNIWPVKPGNPSFWNPGLAPGPPYQYKFVPYTSVSFWPIPNAIYTITLVVAVQPRQGASVLPDEIMRRWDREICDGALGRLVTVPNRPWSNPAAEGKYVASFLSGVSKARSELLRQVNAGGSRARPRAFIA